MTAVSQANLAPPHTSGAKVLLISGVNISKPVDRSDLSRPLPDYAALLEALGPDVIDISNVQAVTRPVVARALGPQWSVALAALRRARHYQAVLATGEDVGLPLALLFKIFRQRTPLLLTCHNIATRRPAFYLKYLRAGTAVNTFQCLSRTQADMLTRYASIREAQIQVLHCQVDHRFFFPRPDIPVRNQICSAGMASRDYATLVAAAQDLDVDVKIAADSPWFHQALNIPMEGLPPRVEARSYQTYAALRQLYAESRLVVVPLLDVPFSAGYTVILEAMAMGKAVIVSRIQQRDDFIVDGWNGIYVTPGNVSELKARLRDLLARPDELLRLGRNARQTVEDHYTLDHFVERMQSGLAHATGSSQPGLH